MYVRHSQLKQDQLKLLDLLSPQHLTDGFANNHIDHGEPNYRLWPELRKLLLTLESYLKKRGIWCKYLWHKNFICISKFDLDFQYEYQTVLRLYHQYNSWCQYCLKFVDSKSLFLLIFFAILVSICLFTVSCMGILQWTHDHLIIWV